MSGLLAMLGVIIQALACALFCFCSSYVLLLGKPETGIKLHYGILMFMLGGVLVLL